MPPLQTSLGNTPLSEIEDPPPFGRRPLSDLATNNPQQPPPVDSSGYGGSNLAIDASNNQSATVNNDSINVNLNGYASKVVVPIDFDMSAQNTENTDAGGRPSGLADGHLEIKLQGTVFEFNFAANGNTVNTSAWIFVRFNDPKAKPVRWLVGQSKSGIPFNVVYVSWFQDANSNTCQAVVVNDSPIDRVELQG